jgi:hypothetical protein
MTIAPGERQFWRMVNASADSYADGQVDGQSMEITCDGVSPPRNCHASSSRTR